MLRPTQFLLQFPAHPVVTTLYHSPRRKDQRTVLCSSRIPAQLAPHHLPRRVHLQSRRRYSPWTVSWSSAAQMLSSNSPANGEKEEDRRQHKSLIAKGLDSGTALPWSWCSRRPRGPAAWRAAVSELASVPSPPPWRRGWRTGGITRPAGKAHHHRAPRRRKSLSRSTCAMPQKHSLTLYRRGPK